MLVCKNNRLSSNGVAHILDIYFFHVSVSVFMSVVCNPVGSGVLLIRIKPTVSIIVNLMFISSLDVCLALQQFAK